MLFWDKSEAQSFLKFTLSRYPKESLDHWVYVVYQLALNTGMRAGEIWGLKPSDLSEDGLKILVERQFNRVSLEFGPTKGRKARVVPCNPELLENLRWIIQQKRIKNDETIFMNENRNPICHDNFAKREFLRDTRDWSKITQGKSIRFHDLRHTATTLMIAAGIDIKTVKEICGHSDIKATMGYVHIVGGSIEQVALKFNIGSGDKPDLILVKKEVNSL